MQQQSNLELRVVLAQHVVLVNVGVALPGVGEPDIGGVDGGEVRDVGGDVAGLGLEPGCVSAESRATSHERSEWRGASAGSLANMGEVE